MGIYDPKLIEVIPLEVQRKSLFPNTKRIGLSFFEGASLLEKEEMIALFEVISFDPNVVGIIYPRIVLKPDTVVVISDKQPRYDGPNNIIKLGEHCLSNVSYRGYETITLYIQNIRAAASGNISAARMLQYVFIHELYHSFFHRIDPVKQLEEPIAELGALLFMNAFLESDKEFEAVFQHVRNKREFREICFYGLGADLFSRVNRDALAFIPLYRHLELKEVNKEHLRTYINRFPNLYAADCKLNRNDTEELLKKVFEIKSLNGLVYATIRVGC